MKYATNIQIHILIYSLLFLVSGSHALSITKKAQTSWSAKSTSALFGKSECQSSRRSFLVISAAVIGATSLSPVPCIADNPEEGLMSTSTVADRLRVVPTFTLVDPKGVPFMVVGEDAKVTGYFFTEFSEAKRILDLARISADKALKEATLELRQQRQTNHLPALTKQQEEEEIGINPWVTARISSITLDLAVTLVIKSISSRNYFQIAPSDADVDDALALTNKTDLAEGKVPLFYMANFTKNDKIPLYFRMSELIADFQQSHPKTELPAVKVTELLSVVTEMVKPGGTDNELKSLIFMAPKESAAKAKDCARVSKGETPFMFGQRIIVL